MTQRDRSTEDLKNRISEALRHGDRMDYTAREKNVDELVQDIHIYYQELEFQNDELKRVRTELETTNLRYADLFMNAPVGYVTYDETYQVLSLNRKLGELLGVTPFEVNGLRLDEHIHPESQDKFYLHVRSLLTTGQPQTCRLGILHASHVHSVLVESNLLVESGARIIRSAVVDLTQELALAKDLARTRTELEERNAELQEYHDRLEATMLAGNIAWWTMDLVTGQVSFNEQKTRMLGYPKDGFRFYRDFVHLVHPEDQEPMMSSMRAYLAGTADTYRTEYRIRSATGEYRWFQDIGVSSSRDENGKTTTMFGVVIDVTELKSIQLEAERANNAKSTFLANMSHEIRTPLNAIIGFTDLLRAAPLQDEYREYLANANESARTLVEIINDLLDLSKIEAGRLDLELLECDLASVLKRVIAMFRPIANKKRISLSLSLPDDLPASVTIDPVRLKQVVINLVGNAIKFTDKGSVDLVVNFKADASSESATFNFAVKDTGIGISPEQKDRLFKAFAQADASITRRFGGTGLGLVISNALVMKMGGQLTVRSEPDKGSEFGFTIHAPCAAFVSKGREFYSDEDATERRATPIAHSRTLTILIVEDVTMNRLLVEAMLRTFLPSAEFVVARNGAEAVELVRMNPPDLVLMDIQMPVMDGYEATLKIREHEKTQGSSKPVPILALTAGNLNDEKIKSMKAGMNGCMTKPIDPDTLKRTILEVLRVESIDQNKPRPVGSTVREAHFGATELLESLHGDTELLAQMIEMSLTQFIEYRDDISTAMRQGDFKAVRRALHKFKGAASTMSCMNLASFLASMENCQIKDMSLLQPLFDDIVKELDLTMAEMRNTR